ncbi:MAG TPA: hypothetical protein VEH84_19425 [Alphaproteobacteria bacterium]|nr:hypothetical protein [Alphaproteobacteria bacterium]
MVWIEIRPAGLAAEAERVLLNRLADVHGTAGAGDVALFRRAPLGAEPALYLSPAAARACGDLLERLGGRSCGSPPMAGAVLLYGRMEAYRLLDGTLPPVLAPTERRLRA